MKINIRRLAYHFKTTYLTLDTGVIILAFIITAGFVWGSLSVMQRNYSLQKTLSAKQQQLKLAQLETRNLELESSYYKTDEYKELSAREQLGLAKPGEKVLVLPANTAKAAQVDALVDRVKTTKTKTPSNMAQWFDFLFGRNSREAEK